MPYESDFYATIGEWARTSADEVVPWLASHVRPQSVIDIGCGTGVWLRRWQEAGVDDILGVDGDYVRRDELEGSPGLFQPHDLTTPLELERSFDLAVCLEVGEHLPDSAA